MLIFLKKFEKNKNEKNYNLLCHEIQLLLKKGRKKFKNYNIILTDENGVIIYNSVLSYNSWCNYKHGNIKYNKIIESTTVNKSEQIGQYFYTDGNNIYFSQKIGSSLLQIIELLIAFGITLSAADFIYVAKATEDAGIVYDEYKIVKDGGLYVFDDKYYKEVELIKEKIDEEKVINLVDEKLQKVKFLFRQMVKFLQKVKQIKIFMKAVMENCMQILVNM